MQDKVELTPLVKVLAQLQKEGYNQNFRVTDDGRLSTKDGQQQFTHDQVQIVNFYRFEGESNPDDLSIMYVLETSSGLKATISDANGH